MGSLLGGESSSTQTSVTNFPSWITPEMKAFYKQMMPSVSGLMDQEYEAYQGPRISDFTQDESNSFDLVRQLQGQAGQGINTAMGINAEVANRGLNGFSQQTLNQYMNPYQTQVMDISRGRQLDEFSRQRNSLSQQQAQTGSFGGSRAAIAQSNLYDNFSRNLAENEANQLYAGYNDSMNRATQGTQMAGQSAMDLANQSSAYQAAGLRDAASLSTQGAQQRGLSQADLDLNYQDWASQKAHPYEQLQWGAGMVNPIAGMLKGQTTTTTQDSGGSGILGAAIGIGSMMMGMPPGIGSMLSGLGGSMASSIGGGFGAGYASSVGPGIFNAMSGMGIGPSGGSGWHAKEGGQVPGYAEGGQVKAGGFLEGQLRANMSKEEQKAGMLSRQDWITANPDQKNNGYRQYTNNGYRQYTKNYQAPIDPSLAQRYLPPQAQQGMQRPTNFAPAGNWGMTASPQPMMPMGGMQQPMNMGMAGMLPRFFNDGGRVSGGMYYGDYPFTGRQVNPLGMYYSNGQIDPRALAMLQQANIPDAPIFSSTIGSLSNTIDSFLSEMDAPVHSQLPEPKIDQQALRMLQQEGLNRPGLAQAGTYRGTGTEMGQYVSPKQQLQMDMEGQGIGGFLMRNPDILDNPIAQYVGEHPVKSFGMGVMMAPELIGAAGLAATGARGIPSLLKGAGALAKNSPMAMKMARYLGVGGMLADDVDTQGMFPTGSPDPAKAEDRRGGEGDPMAESQAGINKVQAGNPNAFNPATDPGMGLPFNGIASGTQMEQWDVTNQINGLGTSKYSPEATATTDSMLKAINPSYSSSTVQKKNEMNTPLIAFGAALLGSKHGFFKALGEAGNAYMATTETKEDRIRKLAQQAIENQLAGRRLEAYEMQNQIAMQSLPYKLQTAQADAAYKNARAASFAGGGQEYNKRVDAYTKLLIENGIERDPKKANLKAKGLVDQEQAYQSAVTTSKPTSDGWGIKQLD